MIQMLLWDAFGSRSRVDIRTSKHIYLYLINPFLGLVWFLGLKNSTTLSISNFKVYIKGMVLSSQNGNLNDP